MKNRIELHLGGRNYAVECGRGYLKTRLEAWKGGDEAAFITDEEVADQRWFGELLKIFEKRFPKHLCLKVPAGEGSKSLSQYGEICSKFAGANFTRKMTVFAVGGGVVGDLAGFVAASFLRGVRLIQIPTTLLAAVDSSVGGKTGVNLPEGKNLVGAFYQPSEVWMDLAVLETLPVRQVAAGMAEVIKYGVIFDRDLFEQVREGRPEDLQSVVERCIALKARTVEADEKEITGERALLNFGHTVGHAIEQTEGYGSFLHGEAVAIGMMAAAYLSRACLGFPEEDLNALREAIASNGLPTGQKGLSYERLRPVIARDKKATQTGVTWVLSPGIGRSQLCSEVSEEQIRDAIAEVAK